MTTTNDNCLHQDGAKDDEGPRQETGRDSIVDEERRPQARYPDYPIRVEVTYGRPARTAAHARRPVCPSRLRSWLTAAAILAVVLPLLLLFLQTTAGSGLTLAQIVDALGNAENVHVSRSYPPTGALIEELWIAPAQDLCLRAIGQKRILYDLARRERYAYAGPEAAADITALSDIPYANIRRLVDSCLGFTLHTIPAGASWTRGPDEADAGDDPYELTYTEQNGSGSPFYRRWLIWVDPVTSRPQAVEQFTRVSLAHEWESAGRTEFQYLGDEEMATIMGERARPDPGGGP